MLYSAFQQKRGNSSSAYSFFLLVSRSLLTVGQVGAQDYGAGRDCATEPARNARGGPVGADARLSCVSDQRHPLAVQAARLYVLRHHARHAEPAGWSQLKEEEEEEEEEKERKRSKPSDYPMQRRFQAALVYVWVRISSW